MDDVEKLKAMLVELGRNKSVFSRQTQELENLQLEVSELQRRADVDPEARKKLNKLNDYMKREGNDSQRRLVEKMAKSEASLKKVGEQLHALSTLQQDSSEKEVPAAKNNLLKKISRNFA
ncbi:hypothetical protein C4K26_4135 [Pseudomonas chlororaphis]|uniref:hypothetical protein n=1 Tax=Pseudomonas chlororaphis TaxID=587753 RepID=UPI000F560B70|nr:hypothetical protein [Pseudomonas chlororaphis]AZD09529.1 hypothetical protein C4K26_4135 [Pseudomonas chlororaphis]